MRSRIASALGWPAQDSNTSGPGLYRVSTSIWIPRGSSHVSSCQKGRSMAFTGRNSLKTMLRMPKTRCCHIRVQTYRVGIRFLALFPAPQTQVVGAHERHSSAALVRCAWAVMRRPDVHRMHPCIIAIGCTVRHTGPPARRRASQGWGTAPGPRSPGEARQGKERSTEQPPGPTAAYVHHGPADHYRRQRHT